VRNLKTGLAAALAVALLSACSSSDPIDANAGAGSTARPQTRFDLANRCFALRELDSKQYVQRAGDGYAATAPRLADAERFYLKPTALGKYLLHTPDSTLLAGDGSSITTAEAPSDQCNWTVEATSPGKYTAQLESEGRSLAANEQGQLVLGAAPSGFAFVPANGCTAYPEISTNSIGETYKGKGTDAPVVGFAEVHTHMAMGHEMSDGSGDVGPAAGGVLYGQMYNRFGAPVALENCQAYHGVNGIQDPEALILDFTPLTLHDTQGWPSFVDWPGNVSQLHQAMYYKWVERA